MLNYFKKFSILQKIALVYCLLFLWVVFIGYVPGFKDEQGALFGLFHLEWWDDLLHFASAVWAIAAAYISIKQVKIYFLLFGTMYFLDGLLGLITGVGYLDLAIFKHGPSNLDLMTKVFANLPHILIGGSQVIFYLIYRNLRMP